MRYLYCLALLGALFLPASAMAAASAYQATSTIQLLSGAQAQGRIGDFVLENDHVVIVISALGHVTHYGENGGTVIENSDANSVAAMPAGRMIVSTRRRASARTA